MTICHYEKRGQTFVGLEIVREALDVGARAFGVRQRDGALEMRGEKSEF
jgi:hypothetical protein